MRNVAAHKKIGVKVGQGEDDPSEWDKHTLESLAALKPEEQALLTLHLEQLSKRSNEGAVKHRERVNKRYDRDTINMLLSAEKHWRSAVGLKTTGLDTSGNIYQGFMRFKKAFE